LVGGHALSELGLFLYEHGAQPRYGQLVVEWAGHLIKVNERENAIETRELPCRVVAIAAKGIDMGRTQHA
jgi:hypothetical protein